MEEVLHPDLCVIGAGSSGLSVAAAATQLGVPVVLIEGGRMGATASIMSAFPPRRCSPRPSAPEAVRAAAPFGVDVIEAQIDPPASTIVNGGIAAIAPNIRSSGSPGSALDHQAKRLDKEHRRGWPRAGSGSHSSWRRDRGHHSTIPGLDEVRATNETIFDRE